MSSNVKVSTISKLTDIRMHDPLPQVDLMFVVKFSETRVPTKGKHRKLKTASSTAVTHRAHVHERNFYSDVSAHL